MPGKLGLGVAVAITTFCTAIATSPQHWRDNHYRIAGPVVAQLQATFATNWLKTRGGVLHGADYFPPLAPTGPYLAQIIRSGAHNENLDLMYLLAIASAQKTLRIENAYFLPDDLMRKELTAAAKRGVKVEVVVPGKRSIKNWCAWPQNGIGRN